MDPWAAYFLGMFTIPILALIYIGIAKAIEGQEEWMNQQSESFQGEVESTTPSQRYWKEQANQSPE